MANVKALTPLKKYRVKVVLAPIFKLFECVCELFVPILVKIIIDYLDKTEPADYEWTTILYPALIMLALAVLGFGVTMVTQYLAARVATSYAYDLKVFFQFLIDENPSFKNYSMQDFKVSILDELQAVDIEEYMEYLKVYTNGDKTFTNKSQSIKRKLASLRSFYIYYYKMFY